MALQQMSTMMLAVCRVTSFGHSIFVKEKIILGMGFGGERIQQPWEDCWIVTTADERCLGDW